MAVEPYDEPNIQGNDSIIRRVNPNQHVVPDENTGGQRLSSKLFTPSSGQNGGMSIDIPTLIEQAGLDPHIFVTTPVFTGSVQFTAEDARSVDLQIGFDPLEDNPYHGEVWGTRDNPCKFTNRQKRKLKEASEWFVELPGVDIR
ncbi:MAG: hypothetical protein AB2704_26060 [Candidatus Thiodiazotropha taylori]